MIFKLSPGATPPSGDSLKIMVFMVFIGFSKVYGFQNKETLEKPIKMTHKESKTVEKPINMTHKKLKTLEKPIKMTHKEPKTLEKPIKTIKTMIFKLSPGATPPSGDSLKIMVFMVFIGFSKVYGFQNTETLEKPIKMTHKESKTVEKPLKMTHKKLKTLEKPIKMTHKEPKTLEKPIKMTHKEPKTLEKPIKTIKTMIFKLSPGATPPSGDSLKIMVFIGFSKVYGFQNKETLEKPIKMTHKESKTVEKPIKMTHKKLKTLEKPIKMTHKEPKTLEKPIKTIKIKLSPGATPPSGDSLKIMVFMVFIGFSKVYGFQNTETLEKPIKMTHKESKTVEKPIKMTHKKLKTLEKPIKMTHKEPKTLEKPIKTIKTMIFKLSPGATPPLGDSLNFMVFVGFSKVFGFQNTETLERPIRMTHKEPKTVEEPIKMTNKEPIALQKPNHASSIFNLRSRPVLDPIPEYSTSIPVQVKN